MEGPADHRNSRWPHRALLITKRCFRLIAGPPSGRASRVLNKLRRQGGSAGLQGRGQLPQPSPAPSLNISECNCLRLAELDSFTFTGKLVAQGIPSQFIRLHPQGEDLGNFTTDKICCAVVSPRVRSRMFGVATDVVSELSSRQPSLARAAFCWCSDLAARCRCRPHCRCHCRSP